MNKIILMGRLTRDPEVRYSQSANPIPIARFSIAVNKNKARTDGITADYFNIVAFDRLATFSEKYLRKGIKILVTGRVGTGTYEKNGVKIPFFEVNAEEIEFAESKNAAGTYDAANSASNNTGSNTVASSINPVDDSGFVMVPDAELDELPFG